MTIQLKELLIHNRELDENLVERILPLSHHSSQYVNFTVLHGLDSFFDL